MSSIVLGVGNGRALFTGTSVAPDEDLVRFADPTDSIINAFDLSVLRGDGIFEATTVWRGFPVSLENHLRRLAQSAKLMNMPEPNIPAMTRAVELVIDQYDDPEPGPMLRIIVSRGLDPDTGVGRSADRTPTIFIFLDAKGTLHSLEPITMASMTRECARRGVGDAILHTEDGYTMECPNSSIVARYGGDFVTPDPRIGILNGTSQREMFAWALQEGHKAVYRKLPITELREADSLYMTHGGWVIPISEIDGRALVVDTAQIQAVNDAIHSGRTHDDALGIGPTGDYE